MARRRRVIGTFYFVVMALSLVAQGAQFTITIPFIPAELPKLAAIYGAPIEQADLDGVIGPEWDDAQRHELKLGKYQAEILLKNDGQYLYIAMIIKTNRRYARGFEGYVVFDNGDGRNFYRGDDIISVQAKNGSLLEADHYYRGEYDFRLDTKMGGENNAYGAGKYDSEKRCYVFEFARELVSNDTKDVPFNPGDRASIIYGWAS